MAHEVQSAFGKEGAEKIREQIQAKLRLHDTGPGMEDLIAYFPHFSRRDLAELQRPVLDGPRPAKYRHGR